MAANDLQLWATFSEPAIPSYGEPALVAEVSLYMHVQKPILNVEARDRNQDILILLLSQAFGHR